MSEALFCLYIFVPTTHCRYDKPGTMAKGRKIGHINIVAATREEARQRLGAIEAAGEQALR